IESSMISKQIERAQKKVAENHFGTRTHPPEFDDVMNKQLTVIYEKRHHALMGERIGMDIANLVWDRVVNIVNTNDYVGCREQFLKVLAMECPFTEEQFVSGKTEQLLEDAFQLAMANFTRRMDRIQEVAWPVIKRVYEEQGSMYERIMVPVTDGRHVYNIPCNLAGAYDSEAKIVAKEFQRVILLHIIDDCWKENLRQLDELKHSVQNASYEQKDPLLIFKLESVKLFDDMVNNMNNRIAAILMRAAIPEQIATNQVREAQPEQHSQRYDEYKADADAAQRGGGMQRAAAQDTREGARRPVQPIVKEKRPGRNDPCPCGSGKKFKNCHGRGIV
ncbi:MAG: SEC-C domain-containing protein, partial [Prevotella sp.]|nr:SEC-C domain-containing protein [Prevotella sp.]